MRSLVDHLDRLGRDCVGQPGSGAIALWQVAVIELRERLEALGSLRPGAPEALRRLAALERAAGELGREVRAAMAAEDRPGVDLGPLLPALEGLCGRLRQLGALHARLARGDETCGGPAGGPE